MLKKKSLVVSVVLLLAIGLLAAGTAFADTDSTNPQTNLFKIFTAKLAGNLGVDESKLTEAIKSAQEDTIKEGVAQGLIPADKAEKIQAAIQDGKMMGFGFCREGKPRGDFRGKAGAFKLNCLPEILGMTPEEFAAELKAGQTLEQIASAKGMTLEQFKAKWLETEKAALDEKVSQGTLTAEQADTIYTKLQNMDLSKFGIGPKGPMKKQN